jgi:hypothetical protein
VSIRTLLVSAGLATLVCGVAVSQPPPKPATPPPAPPPSGVTPPPYLPPRPSPPAPPAPRSVEELLTELESIKAQKAELERKEKELKAAIAKKLEEQAERLKKLGIAPKAVEHAGALHPLRFAMDGPKKDKEEAVIVLLANIAPAGPPQFATAANELVDKLARQLPQMANEQKSKPKIKILSPKQVDKFKLANPKWKDMNANEIGDKLGADFVLEIQLDKLRLYQPGSLSTVYEGRAEVQVKVYEVGTEDAKGKYSLPNQYSLSFTYPHSGIPATDAMPETKFKELFYDNLAADIARMHTDPKPSGSLKPAEPDRVGRIFIEGNTKTPDGKILGKLDLRPGQILQYPKLEDAYMKLRKAGFQDVMIEVLPNELDSVFKDIRVRVTEKGAR